MLRGSKSIQLRSKLRGTDENLTGFGDELRHRDEMPECCGKNQKNDGDLTQEGNSKKDQEDAVQEQKGFEIR